MVNACDSPAARQLELALPDDVRIPSRALSTGTSHLGAAFAVDGCTPASTGASPGLEFSAEVRRLTDGTGVDVAIEIVGSRTFGQTLRCMAAGARVVVV
ncbi:MAG TPA: zinc-binding dehydrogenase, partial [Myxococcaceae bacterium]